ncbi:unnamed protein product [Protopolystoma xenopodis]|uniref:Uncharacterized protein n=1 Tax=Protopolystoma xenopodis TaxID=117903 RepID=A0A448WP98_9PLAT|nr:unnamed protein product [Protopolystoma xenopodis]
MAKLTDDADYDAGENEFVAWCGEWQNSLMMPTTMPAKRRRMYQVHGRMLEIKTTTMADDFGLDAFYIVSLNTRPSCSTHCLSFSLKRRVVLIHLLVSPETVVVDLCELVFGAPLCDPDESLPSFRLSCDGHRQSSTSRFTLIYQKQLSKKDDRLKAYLLLMVQFGQIAQ